MAKICRGYVLVQHWIVNCPWSEGTEGPMTVVYGITSECTGPFQATGIELNCRPHNLSCDLHEKERDKLVAVITRTEQWPVSKSKMMLKYYKDFKQFTDRIVLNEG